MNKNIFGIALILGLAVSAASCGNKTYQNINYLQNVNADTSMVMMVNRGILVQPKDIISIVVSSRNPELSAMFNLSTVSYQAGSEYSTSGGYNRIMGYSVNDNGEIDFPIIGKIQVGGLTRWEVAEKVKGEIISKSLLKDPVVTVEFMNFKISVVGEVANPGSYTISGDKISILEALSLAGDLTIFGKRNNVSVIREKDGVRSIYQMDLRSTELFNSPAYYLQQNDVVYVEPNRVRAGQSTINENNFRSVSFWVSIGSFIVTAANIIVTIAGQNR